MGAANYSTKPDFRPSFSSSSVSEEEQPSEEEMVNLNRFQLASFDSAAIRDNNYIDTELSASTTMMTALPNTKETTTTPQNQLITTSKSPLQEKQIKRTHKRRKCVQGPDQKLCHCQSEKRRRELISRRYRDLCAVVPGLNNKLYTRRYILDETARWLAQLLEGNEALRRQRDRLCEESMESI